VSTLKASYTISCSSAFRDAVIALAGRRRVNAGDVARSVMLVVPSAVIGAYPDPGVPDPADRETVVLRSGEAAGRTLRRKPRLQLRLPPGLDPVLVRKALNLALALDAGTMGLVVRDPTGPVLGPAPALSPPAFQSPPPPPPPPSPSAAEAARLRDDVARLHSIVSVLSFEPLEDGVRDRAEALHVMGFPPYASPDSRDLRARFRLLATVHHPDAVHGSHARMSQLNAAMEILRR
jgi:hypothetical protein